MSAQGKGLRIGIAGASGSLGREVLSVLSDRRVPVAEIMTRELITSGPETPLKTVLTRLTQHEIRHMPIVSESGVLLGIISKRDMLLAHLTTEGLVGPATASRIMTREVITVRPETCATVAAGTMFARRFGSLPVVDGSVR